MFDRFTDRSRKVMSLARQNAERLNHDYIGTEHILLGLIQEGSGVAANVLENLDVDLKKVTQEVLKLVKPGDDTVTLGQLPFTPRAKKVLDFAIDEARALDHNYVGTEHLLLGLLREYEGLAAQILMNLGLKLADVRAEICDFLGAAPADSPRFANASAPARKNVFPPLSESALRVLVLARREAERLKHDKLCAEHILLALTQWPAVFTNPQRLCAQVEERLRPGDSPIKSLEMTESFMRVLALAREEAQTLGRRATCLEHLVLGLLRLESGIAFEKLCDSGLQLDEVRKQARTVHEQLKFLRWQIDGAL